MNSQEFVKEVRDSNLTEKEKIDFLYRYEDFQKYQKIIKNTLLEFHKLCEKNQIWYQVAYGSLLGVIRDGGQIPWDYDVDVFVKIEDRENLVKVLKEQLNDNYYFYCPEIDRKCRHTFIRVTPRGYRSEVLHVDVFYLIGLPQNSVIRNLTKKAICFLSKIRYIKYVKIKDEWYGNLKRFLKFAFAKIVTFIIPIRIVTKIFECLIHKWPIEDNELLGTADSFANQNDFFRDDFLQTELYPFENEKVRIPKNYKEVLQVCFGDYRYIYPLKNRMQEVVNSYNRLTWK